VEGSPRSAVHLVLRISRNPHRYVLQAGEYQCVAWFGAVALTSLPAKLSIAVLGDFPHLDVPLSDNSTDSQSGLHVLHASGPVRAGISTKSRDVDNSASVYVVEVFAGETAILPCPPPPSDPPATITFYKNGLPMPTQTDRIKLLESGNLHIIDVEASDYGQYTCTASNHITAEVIESQHILKLVVKDAPSSNSRASSSSSLAWAPEQRYVSQIGRNVTLECAATGWPRPQVRWSRADRRPLPAGRYFPLGGTSLTLTELSDQDQGAYSCEVSNGGGGALIASTVLELTEPVSMIKWPQDSRVEEGSRIAFDCLARGRPPPQHYWVFNGNALRTNSSYVSIEDQRLVISKVSKRHAGIFQCFVFNSLAAVDGGAATLQVIPRARSSQDHQDELEEDEQEQEQEEEEEDWHDSFDPTPPPSKSEKGGKGKKGKQHTRIREMIPPSRPNMTRLTDESVMVRWSVPSNQGLPIQFFKVQFKEADKRGTRWKTIDEDIPSHIRSYEVTSLKAGFTYRFRIAAVYSNNDNKLGPNSGRFLLEKDQPKRKPTFSPVILVAETVSQSAVEIQWKYPELDSIPLEGFFIYYRSTTSAGEYAKVTVDRNTRSHIVTHLLPETHYDLKMQAFNLQGTSEFSRIVTTKTLGSPIYPSPTRHSHNSFSPNHNQVDNSLDGLDNVSSDSSVSSDTLYMVLGSVLGGLTVLVVLLVALYQCRQKTPQRGSNQSAWTDIDGLNSKAPITNENGNIISSGNLPYHHKMHNGHGHSTIYPAQHEPLFIDHNNCQQMQFEDKDDTVETSFCEESQPSPCDYLRPGEGLSLKRGGYIMSDIAPPATILRESNTLPLLMHDGRMDPCLNSSDWQSVPPAQSEKFI